MRARRQVVSGAREHMRRPFLFARTAYLRVCRALAHTHEQMRSPVCATILFFVPHARRHTMRSIPRFRRACPPCTSRHLLRTLSAPARTPAGCTIRHFSHPQTLCDCSRAPPLDPIHPQPHLLPTLHPTPPYPDGRKLPAAVHWGVPKGGAAGGVRTRAVLYTPGHDGCMLLYAARRPCVCRCVCAVCVCVCVCRVVM